MAPRLEKIPLHDVTSLAWREETAHTICSFQMTVFNVGHTCCPTSVDGAQIHLKPWPGPWASPSSVNFPFLFWFHGFVTFSPVEWPPAWPLAVCFPSLEATVACWTNSQMSPNLYQDQMWPVLKCNNPVKMRLQIVHHYQERRSHYLHRDVSHRCILMVPLHNEERAAKPPDLI